MEKINFAPVPEDEIFRYVPAIEIIGYGMEVRDILRPIHAGYELTRNH